MVVVLCGSRFAAPTPFSGLVPCSLLSFRVCFLPVSLPVGAFFVFFVLVGKLSRCCLAAVVASWVTPGFPGYVKNLFEDLHSKQHPGRVVVDYLNCFRGLVDNSRE
ncbi:hypothetical protein ACS0TY_018421 [Phlomoides rotata]